MSEWTDPDREFFDPERESLAEVEDLLRLAADDLPTVRSGLRAEIVTQAQKSQRELRVQHMLWGGLAVALLFFGGLVWWPMSLNSTLAFNFEPRTEPEKPSVHASMNSMDWDLLEFKIQLRRLEILRNAF